MNATSSALPTEKVPPVSTHQAIASIGRAGKGSATPTTAGFFPGPLGVPPSTRGIVLCQIVANPTARDGATRQSLTTNG